MGKAKQAQLIKEAGHRLSPYQRKMARYDRIDEAFDRSVPRLREAILDEHSPLIGMTIKRMPHGGMFIVIVRDNDLKEEEMLSGGEDLIDALMAIDVKLNKSDWKPKKKWDPSKAK